MIDIVLFGIRDVIDIVLFGIVLFDIKDVIGIRDVTELLEETRWEKMCNQLQMVTPIT